MQVCLFHSVDKGQRSFRSLRGPQVLRGVSSETVRRETSQPPTLRGVPSQSALRALVPAFLSTSGNRGRGRRQCSTQIQLSAVRLPETCALRWTAWDTELLAQAGFTCPLPEAVRSCVWLDVHCPYMESRPMARI